MGRACCPHLPRFLPREKSMSTLPPEKTRQPESALVPYCGRLHRIIDGLPVAHRCKILPAESLIAAINGELERAVSLMAQAAAQGPLLEHSGVWKLRRR
jgi:hypothetical protein